MFVRQNDLLLEEEDPSHVTAMNAPSASPISIYADRVSRSWYGSTAKFGIWRCFGAAPHKQLKDKTTAVCATRFLHAGSRAGHNIPFVSGVAAPHYPSPCINHQATDVVASIATGSSATFLRHSMGDYHPATLTKHTATQHHVTPKPRFIITGFGRFCGVSANPTEQLVNWLAQTSCQTPAPAATTAEPQQELQSISPAASELPYCISSLDVLEVSADAVDRFMQKQQQVILQHTAASSSAEGPQPVVLLHFGVDTQVSYLACGWQVVQTGPC